MLIGLQIFFLNRRIDVSREDQQRNEDGRELGESNREHDPKGEEKARLNACDWPARNVKAAPLQFCNSAEVPT